MVKIFALIALRFVSGCECDNELSFPGTSCLTLQSQGKDCSGCTYCAKAYDSESYQVDAWVYAINEIRYLFQAGEVVWSQEIAEDVFDYINREEEPKYGPDMWDVEHSSNKYPEDPRYDSYYRKPPYGPAAENIAQSSLWDDGEISCPFVPDIAMGWAAENELCQRADCSDHVQFGQVGHFTAMTWKGAQTFGCAATRHGTTMCRFKGDDSRDCTTPNMEYDADGDCHHNVNVWQYFTFDACKSGGFAMNSTLV